MNSRLDITSRNDIDLLIGIFYERVRKHKHLGPIFNKAIENWDEHLKVIGDFWMNTIFYDHVYQGNPLKKHLQLDENLNGTIEQAHFGNWLELWFSTIDEHFEGEKAHLAKERARNMAHIIFMRIYEQRNK